MMPPKRDRMGKIRVLLPPTALQPDHAHFPDFHDHPAPARSDRAGMDSRAPPKTPLLELSSSRTGFPRA